MIDKILVWWRWKGRYTWSKYRRRIFELNSHRSTVPNVTTFNEIESRLGEITWVANGPFHLYDAISFPETVWKHKKDDCDGFSVIAAALLKKGIVA